VGLFSTKRKTKVGTTVVRSLEDDKVPNSLITGFVIAQQQKQPIYSSVLEEFMDGISLKADRMYTYGAGSYTYGLPSGQFRSPSEGNPAVKTVLAGVHSVAESAISIQYTYVVPYNMHHVAWMQIIDNHGYIEGSNTLGNLTTSMGTTVWLDDMVVVVPAADYDLALLELNEGYDLKTFHKWGRVARAGYSPTRPYTHHFANLGIRAHSAVERSTTATVAHVRVQYVWEVASAWQQHGSTPPTIHTSSFTLSLAAYNDAADYYHVAYNVSGGATKYWLYEDGSGGYTALDLIFNTPQTTNGQFFPFLYFRFNKASPLANTSSVDYIHSKKMAGKIEMNYDEVVAEIESNPGIGDVEQAMQIMAVPATTSNEIELRYLFDFWKAYSSQVIATDWAPGEHSLVIQDKRFKLTLQNRGVTTHLVAGVTGDVGTYSMVYVPVTWPQLIEHGYRSTLTAGGRPAEHRYRHQISASIYEEVIVRDMQLMFHIIGNYTTTAGDGYDPNGILLTVPLDRSITQFYSLRDREILYSRGLHLVFNSVIIIKIKWYQTGLFKFFVMVIMVAIVIVSMGTMAPAMAMQIAAVNFALGAAAANMAVMVAIAKMMIVTIVIAVAVKFISKHLGPVGSMILGAVLLAAAFYFAPASASLAMPSMGFTSSQVLLQIATSLLTFDHFERLTKGIAGKMAELSVLQDERDKELEEANALLDQSNYLFPFVIFGEEPDDFYNRTIHSGNIGILAIDQVEAYVDQALKLPTLRTTLQPIAVGTQ